MSTEDLYNPQNYDYTYVHSDDLALVLNYLILQYIFPSSIVWNDVKEVK